MKVIIMMKATDRQKAIMQILQKNNSIRISQVSEIFGVSNETARRDLEYLQKKKLLRRVHGGAVLESAAPFRFEESQQSENPSSLQEMLAQAGAELVSDNDIIFIGHGTTMQYLSRYLRQRPGITVLTNSQLVINELMGSNVTLYSLGGLIDPDEQNMNGSIPISTIQKFYANKAFISCGGATINDGITDYNSDGTLLNLMLMHAEKRYLVASSNKFGRNAFGKVCELQDFSGIICDSGLDPEYREAIIQMNIDLHLIEK